MAASTSPALGSALALSAFAAFAAFDIVVVPFPFTDREATKRRPALVVSHTAFNRPSAHSVLAMITSAEQFPWRGDCSIQDLISAGLTTACLIRLKLFTLDHRLIIRKAGVLSPGDQKSLRAAWKGLLAV
jgi:mRNA interferase MazF